MTRASQKVREVALALEAAERLGKHWRVDDAGESPDLLVHEDEQGFGLEVTEIYAGRVNKHRGSAVKKSESDIDRSLYALWRAGSAIQATVTC